MENDILITLISALIAAISFAAFASAPLRFMIAQGVLPLLFCGFAMFIMSASDKEMRVKALRRRLFRPNNMVRQSRKRCV